MRPTYQVVYLPEAEAALEKTATYITEHDGPQRAANWLLRMIESIDKLETMPSIFAERGVRAGWKIRAKPVMSHLAYYSSMNHAVSCSSSISPLVRRDPNATNMRTTRNYVPEAA